MKHRFTIYEVEVDPRSKPDDEYGGDMNCIAHPATRKGALSRAKKESMRDTCMGGKKLHEIWVEKMDEDHEIIEQWAFKKGVQTFHIIPA